MTAASQDSPQRLEKLLQGPDLNPMKEFGTTGAFYMAFYMASRARASQMHTYQM